jgi:phosphate transport system substrate-binding protein
MVDPVLEEFLKFVLSKEGQQLILDQGVFLPLRSFQQSASFNKLAAAP